MDAQESVWHRRLSQSYHSLLLLVQGDTEALLPHPRSFEGVLRS
jgi:hypothetical protein